MQELGNLFSVGDLVVVCSSPRPSSDITWAYGMEKTCGCVGIVTGLLPQYDGVQVKFESTGATWSYKNSWLTPVEKSEIKQNKQISIERVGDLTSVTISGHLTKDDVQSILNLILL